MSLCDECVVGENNSQLNFLGDLMNTAGFIHEGTPVGKSMSLVEISLFKQGYWNHRQLA